MGWGIGPFRFSTEAKRLYGKLVGIRKKNEEKDDPQVDPTYLAWPGTDEQKISLATEDFDYLNLLNFPELIPIQVPFLLDYSTKPAFYITKSAKEMPKGSKISFYEPDNYIITFALYGQNINPIIKKMEISWDGTWKPKVMLLD